MLVTEIIVFYLRKPPVKKVVFFSNNYCIYAIRWYNKSIGTADANERKRLDRQGKVNRNR